jgi:hypothetical protein
MYLTLCKIKGKAGYTSKQQLHSNYEVVATVFSLPLAASLPPFSFAGSVLLDVGPGEVGPVGAGVGLEDASFASLSLNPFTWR